jgi:hypothetical protein
MSLVKHAEREMKLAGLYDKDSDYGGMIAEAVMRLVKIHASEGHSGCSHSLALEVFNRVANFKTLTPITSDPADWMHVGDDPDGTPVYQSNRSPGFFSVDGGKTWYDLDDKEKKNWPKNRMGE